MFIECWITFARNLGWILGPYGGVEDRPYADVKNVKSIRQSDALGTSAENNKHPHRKLNWHSVQGGQEYCFGMFYRCMYKP